MPFIDPPNNKLLRMAGGVSLALTHSWSSRHMLRSAAVAVHAIPQITDFQVEWLKSGMPKRWLEGDLLDRVMG